VLVGRNQAIYRHDGGHRYGHNKLNTLPLATQFRASTYIDISWKIHEVSAHPSKDAADSRDDHIQKKQKYMQVHRAYL